MLIEAGDILTKIQEQMTDLVTLGTTMKSRLSSLQEALTSLNNVLSCPFCSGIETKESKYRTSTITCNTCHAIYSPNVKIIDKKELMYDLMINYKVCPNCIEKTVTWHQFQFEAKCDKCMQGWAPDLFIAAYNTFGIKEKYKHMEEKIDPITINVSNIINDLDTIEENNG